jgi:hypothetical protein
MNSRIARSVTSVALALGCAGCGNHAGLSPVDGKVFYKGEPAAGARVYFHRTDADGSHGPVPMGEVDHDGSFWLVSGDLGGGAAPGRYDVRVVWPEGPLRTHHADLAKKVGKAAARGSKTELKADDRLNGRYTDPTHARLHAEVKSGSNHLEAFELSN